MDDEVYRSEFACLWRTASAELAKPVKKQALGNGQQQAYFSLESLPILEKPDHGPVEDSGEGPPAAS